MSNHYHATAVMQSIHTLWACLVMAAALSRAVTYILISVVPIKSVNPSRPVSELVTAFLLTCGGLVIMASVSQILHRLCHVRM